MIIASALTLSAIEAVDFSLIFRQVTVIFTIVSLLYAVLRLLGGGLKPRETTLATQAKVLPRYTIIVPLFHEAHMVPDLIESLSEFDYPEDRLDIIFACEAVDGETVKVANALSKPPFRVIVVPPIKSGEPQTKPRALNYCLERSHGDIVTIYDAEDRPDPNQLRAAAAAFDAHPDWVALQAPLDYHNSSQSWLSAQFALEYASLFHVQLPAYDRMGLPFPLGGTSNHINGLM